METQVKSSNKDRMPIVIISYFFGRELSYCSEEKINPDLTMWEHRIQQFLDKGLELRIIGPTGALFKMDERYSEIKQSLHDNILELSYVDDSQESIYDWLGALRWPHDFFQQFGDTLYCPGNRKNFGDTNYPLRYMNQILQQLGLEGVSIKKNIVGEGGLHTRMGKLCLFSGAVQNHISQLDAINQQGYKFEVMPLISIEMQDTPQAMRLRERIGYNHHIDMDINCAENSNGETLGVVSQDFYDVFPGFIEGIRSSLADLYIVTDLGEVTDGAINFCPLPFGMVAVSEGTVKVNSVLREFLSKDNVIELHRLDTEVRYQGGLLCSSNIILPYEL